MKDNLRSHVETALSCLVYVAIGTALATQVSAQNFAPKTTQLNAPMPALPSQIQALPVAACETNKSPDSMCTLPLKKGPDAKICFSIKHSRCFELKDDHLIQTVSGHPAQDSALNRTQVSNVKMTIANYTSWLEGELSKKSKADSLCRDLVSIDSKSEHKEFCLSKLLAKDAQAKTKGVLAILENPAGSK